MTENYEEQRQIFHHYVGHYLFALEEDVENEKTAKIQKRKSKLVEQLKGMGKFNLATKCLSLLERYDFLSIQKVQNFRDDYNNLDPKIKEFEKVLAQMKHAKK